jgi:hypothetical protein
LEVLSDTPPSTPIGRITGNETGREEADGPQKRPDEDDGHWYQVMMMMMIQVVSEELEIHTLEILLLKKHLF